jgi:hypothetical protein
MQSSSLLGAGNDGGTTERREGRPKIGLDVVKIGFEDSERVERRSGSERGWFGREAPFCGIDGVARSEERRWVVVSIRRMEGGW